MINSRFRFQPLLQEKKNETQMTPLSQIFEHKIVAIIRGAQPGDVLNIARALYEGGIRLIEVTLNSPNALEIIEHLCETMKDSMLIGAGTVLDTETTKAAINAGAQFIISPCFNIEVIKMTKQHGAVSIPGAYTPTEIVNAYNSGGDIIKVFPASSNVNYIKEIRAPLPHIPLMPTGGVSMENIAEFKKAGAVAYGIGSALVNTKEAINKTYLQQLTNNARRFIEAIADVSS